MNYEVIVVSLSAALAVLCLFLVGIVLVKSSISLDKNEDKDLFDRFIEKKKQELAGRPGAMKYSLYLTLMLVIPVALGGSSYLFFGNIILSAGFFVSGFFVPEFIVRSSARKQEKLFEERYGRALRQLSSSLRAGLTIEQAVDDLCKCRFIHYTVRDAFYEVDAAIKIGIPIPEAFAKMAEKINSDDVKDVASAIAMQSVVGGSESEVIENISSNISSRIMTRKEINSIFSGTKVTVIGMSVLPFLIVFILFNGSPGYFKPCVGNPIAIGIMIAMFGIMIAGIGVMYKMYKKGTGR